MASYPQLQSIRSIKHIKKEILKRMRAYEARVNPPTVPPPVDESKLLLGTIPREFPTLDATVRTKDGSRHSRAFRAQGKLPVMLYGNRKSTGERVKQLATVKRQDVDKLLRLYGESIENSLVRVNLHPEDSKDIVDYGLCTPRDLQLDPVKDTPVNLNLLLFEPGRVLDVPISFFNAEECPGLKRGGYINFIHRSLKVKALSEYVPQTMVVDLTTKQIGDRIRMRDIDFPKSIKLMGFNKAEDIGNVIVATIGGKGGGSKGDNETD